MDFLLPYTLVIREMSIKQLNRMTCLEEWFQYTLRAEAIVKK
jgi:hypothetical protein